MALDLCDDDDKLMTEVLTPWTEVAQDSNPEWISPLSRPRRGRRRASA